MRTARLTLTALACLGLAAAGRPADAAPIGVLTDGGFEATTSQLVQLGWTSADYGLWGVGDAFSIVGPMGGATPLGGSNMLAFNNTFGASTDIYQIVDLSAYASDIDAGRVTANLSVFYNATLSVSTSFGLRLGGWTSAPTSFTGFSTLGGPLTGLTIDADSSTWEQFNVSVLIPTGFHHVALGLHEPAGGTIGYADNAALSLTIAPEQFPNPPPCSCSAPASPWWVCGIGSASSSDRRA